MGLRYGTMTTVLPTRMVLVHAATYASTVNVSRNGASCGRLNEPSGVYGYWFVGAVGSTR